MPLYRLIATHDIHNTANMGYAHRFSADVDLLKRDAEKRHADNYELHLASVARGGDDVLFPGILETLVWKAGKRPETPAFAYDGSTGAGGGQAGYIIEQITLLEERTAHQMTTARTTTPLLTLLVERADTTAYGQFRDALRSRHAPVYELAPALATMLETAATPRHAKLARWLLQDLATYRPDAFSDCLGMEYAGIVVAPEVFVNWQRWLAAEMGAQTPAACIMREREDRAYWERHKDEATDYDAEESCYFEWERDAGNRNRWTMALRWK